MPAAVPRYEYRCAQCQRSIWLRQAEAHGKERVFCGRSCKYEWDRQHRRKAVADKIWNKVAFGEADECWPWQGATTPKGYPLIHKGGRGSGTTLAHRQAYELLHGPIGTATLLVCHTCDYPRCMNPLHWFLGTNQDNMGDMVAKGRSPRMAGERNPRAKLTTNQVQVISVRLAAGERPTALAREYGVTPAMISHIRYGRSWVEAARG